MSIRVKPTLSNDQADHDTLLTCSEAAAYLRRPIRTMYFWRYSGKGPDYIRAGRSLLYRKSELDNWLQRNEVKHAQ
jgi:hypothetical protein